MRNRKRFRTGNGEIDPRLKPEGVIAALLSAVVVFAAMIQLEKNILTQYEKGQIYITAVDIPRGQIITENNYTKYLEERQIDNALIPPSAVNSPEQIQNLVAKTDIEQGVLLTQGMFEPLEEVLEELETPVVAGFKAKDLYQVAGGILRSGDRVNIYSVKEEKVTLLWQNIFVQQVFDVSGSAIAQGDTTTAAHRINIYLDSEDVELFYKELEAGTLRVVKSVNKSFERPRKRAENFQEEK